MTCTPRHPREATLSHRPASICIPGKSLEDRLSRQPQQSNMGDGLPRGTRQAIQGPCPFWNPADSGSGCALIPDPAVRESGLRALDADPPIHIRALAGRSVEKTSWQLKERGGAREKPGGE